MEGVEDGCGGFWRTDAQGAVGTTPQCHSPNPNHCGTHFLAACLLQAADDDMQGTFETIGTPSLSKSLIEKSESSRPVTPMDKLLLAVCLAVFLFASERDCAPCL